MGILGSLGEIAGGVSEGLEKAQTRRARQAQIDAAKLELELKQQKKTLDDNLAANIANAPVAGKTQIGSKMGAEGYFGMQELSRINDERNDRQPQSPLSELAGKLSGMFTRKAAERTAIAADLRPPPPAAVGPDGRPTLVAPPPAYTPPPRPPGVNGIVPDVPGLPSADQVNVPEMGLGQKPPVVGLGTDQARFNRDAAPAAEPATPDMVPEAGTGGQEMRPATATDRQLYLAKAYAEAHQFDKAIEANDKYLKLVAADYTAGMPFMTLSELSDHASKTFGGDYRVTKDGDENYTVTHYTPGADGKPVGEVIAQNKRMGELQAEFGRRVGGDPEAARDLGLASRASYIAELKARSDISTQGAQARAYGATAEKAIADAGQTTEETKALAVKAAASKKFADNVERLKDPWAPVVRAREYAAFANEGGFTDDKGIFWNKATATDPTTGAMATESVNRYNKIQQVAQAKFQKITGVKEGLIKVGDPDSDKPFVLKDLYGRPAGVFATPEEAQKALMGEMAKGKDGIYGVVKTPQDIANIINRNVQAAAKQPPAGTAPAPAPKPKPPAPPPPPPPPPGTAADLAALKADHAKAYAAYTKAKDATTRAAAAAQMFALARKMDAVKGDVSKARNNKTLQSVVDRRLDTSDEGVD